MKVDAPSTIWQSDITYIPIGDKHYYVVLIIDVYTKNIVGYSVTDHMRATANVSALKMALKQHKAPQIHHSDRGSQYTYKGYVELLEKHGTSISMATSAQDNAYAERINRTIKEEYLDHWKPKSLSQLKMMIKKAVKNYNQKRIHNQLDRTTPIQFENQLVEQKGKSITIFNNQILN